MSAIPAKDKKKYVPKIHCFSEVSSCMDVAFDLIRKGRLDIWDSIIAKNQMDGRGQMRKHWVSLEGNLFAAIRLPYVAPFDSTAASIAISALCANALRSFGQNIMLKWPNDLIICQDNKIAKIAGILIEDRKEGLIAGIGINILSAPYLSKTDNDFYIPAASLSQIAVNNRLPAPHELWMALVKHVYSLYKNGPLFSEIWKPLAEDMLLWHGAKVDWLEGDMRETGILCGLADNGAAILETSQGKKEILSGTIRHIATA